ncbi:MAG: hypothetical protein PQJ28_00975 [Spirochaetales bacterium]|nr:hypothetical protein [Spirochaetales bacterium]
MVKDKIRNISAILLFAFYCMGVIIASYSSFSTLENQYSSDVNTKNQTCFSNITTNFYYAATRTERLTQDSHHGPVVDLKDWGNTPFGIIHADEILFKSKFSQYTRRAISFLIRYRKADILFPFHYFW